MFRKSKENKLKKQRFNQILRVADRIALLNPKGLVHYVNILGRHYQSVCMSKVVSCIEGENKPEIYPGEAWFNFKEPLNSKNENAYNFLDLRSDLIRKLEFSSSLIIPCPWGWESLAKCLSFLGFEDENSNGWEKWEQKTNHKIEYWLPFGIGWVGGGNHSIASALVKGIGSIKTNHINDFSRLFPHVRFDGNAFIKVSDNSVIQEVDDLERVLKKLCKNSIKTVE